MTSEQPQQIVRSAYDNISSWYLDWVVSDEKHASSPRTLYTKKLLSYLGPSPEILELGCGPGVPVLKLLLEAGARVVANDISTAQIDLARKTVAAVGGEGTVEFVEGDMSDLSFEIERFDGVISFFTLFHLPRSELKSFLQKAFRWLRPGGVFVFNLALFDEEEIHGEMLGYGMFWSSFGEEESLALFGEVGFEIVETERRVAGNGELEEGDADFGVEFLWGVARKPVAG